MITPMTKYSFILLKGEETRLLEKLQEIGLVDVTRSSKPVDDTSQKLAGEVELLSGLIQGLGKADVPEGIEPEHIDGDIVRLAGGQIMRYSEDSVEIKALEKEVKDRGGRAGRGRCSPALPCADKKAVQARMGSGICPLRD